MHRDWDAKDAPLVDGTSPQIRRELTAGEDGAHSRGTTYPPLQQLPVEWTAAGLFFVRCERCDPPDSRRVPRNGAGVSLKLCAPKKENKSRPLVSSQLIYTRRLVGHRLVARLHPNPRTRFDHRLARLPAGGMLAEPRRREPHTYPSQSSPDSGERGGKTRGLHFHLSSALRRAAHCDRVLNGKLGLEKSRNKRRNAELPGQKVFRENRKEWEVFSTQDHCSVHMNNWQITALNLASIFGITPNSVHDYLWI